MSSVRRMVAWSLVALLAACSGDSTAPAKVARADLLRSYTAVTFTAGGGGTIVDQLARGATLTITLRADGTTTGHLFVPNQTGGADTDADLAGTFTFDEATQEVTFDQAADTFMRDMPFQPVRANGGIELIGQATFGGTTLRVVLR